MRKKIIAAVLFATTLISFPSLAQQPAQAAPSCAEATCNKPRECAQSKCNPFEGLNLTGQQQAQLKELREQHAAKNKEKCEKARKDKAEARECRKECKKNYLAQVKAILTPEQYVTILENTYINTNNRGKAAMKNRKHDGKCDKNSQNHNRPYCKYPKKVQQ